MRFFLMFWNLALFLHFAEDWNRPLLCLTAILFSLLSWGLRSLLTAWRLTTFASMAFCWYQFPIQANHMNYLTFANTSLFAMSFFIPLQQSRIYLRMIMYSLSSVYLWAGIHKLNSDFFNPPVSCATNMIGRFTKRYFDYKLNKELFQSNLPAIAAVTVELAISFLIPFRRTFLFATTLCIGLHAFLVPVGFVDFASVSMALFALAFLSEDILSENYKRHFMHLAHIYFWAQLAGGTFTGLMQFGLNARLTYFAQVFFWELFAGCILFFVYVTIRSRGSAWVAAPPASDPPLLLRAKVALFLPAILVFLFGSQNYLGLSTAGTFSMFSNLRTEGGSWNHLFIPESIKIFDFQEKLYYVKRISRKFRKENHDHPSPGYAMPEFEIFRLLRQWEKRGIKPDNFEVIPLFDRSQMFDIFSNSYFENDPFSDLQRKWLYFRKVQNLDEPNRCRW